MTMGINNFKLRGGFYRTTGGVRHQPWTRPHDRAIRRIAASFSSCGKTRWKAKFLLKLNKKSSNTLFFCCACGDWHDPAVITLDLFLNCVACPLFFTLSLFCTLIFTDDFVSYCGLVPLAAAAAAAAMALLAFLCRIPHALQSDCEVKKREMIIF